MELPTWERIELASESWLASDKLLSVAAMVVWIWIVAACT